MAAEGFHEGELAVQSRAGVRAQAARLGGTMLAVPDLNGGISGFLAERDFAVLTARDADGRLWTSALIASAGFLEARESYRGKLGLVRQGNGVNLKTFTGNREAPEMRLTLRIGDRVKRVTLIEDYPDALGRLPELVDRIGGPNTWPVR